MKKLDVSLREQPPMAAWSKNHLKNGQLLGIAPHQVMPAGLRVDASTLVTVEIRTGHRASGASGQKTQKMGMGD